MLPALSILVCVSSQFAFHNLKVLCLNAYPTSCEKLLFSRTFARLYDNNSVFGYISTSAVPLDAVIVPRSSFFTQNKSFDITLFVCSLEI